MHTHSKISKLILFLVAVLLIIGGYYIYKVKTSDPFDKIDTAEDAIPKGKVGMSLYENYLYNFKFEYPENLYMKESDKGTPSKPQLNIILVEGIKESIDLIEGNYTSPGREGPTSITLNVYQNEKKLNLADWMKQDVNSNISSEKTSVASVNGLPGVSYKWSGLYEGESVIITKGTQVYFFSVTWLTPEDQILKDFDLILN